MGDVEQFSLFGEDIFGNPIEQQIKTTLGKEFIFSPFSVLDARSGDWQDRKRGWISCGIEGEVGRSENLTVSGAAASFDYYRVKEGTRENTDVSGTSIFDPVLTELNYKWFCPPNGQIIDPFAGGSVRGIVALLLGFKYWGCDLSGRQIAANYEQAEKICPDNIPEWINGDSMEKLDDAPEADFIFSCPPYGDLEVYSDDPQDLSNMEYHTFIAAYKRIILRAIKKLKNDRFACFVVGDFRDKKGFYRGFVADTVKAFQEMGMPLYNDAVIVTAVGSLSMRARTPFDVSRKLGKTHQNVLVFVKGDPKEATKKIKEG
jgi:hypothetical protein